MADKPPTPAVKRAFDARVENPWNQAELQQKDAGFFESRRIRKRMERLVESVSRALEAAKLEVPFWPLEGGAKPAAHLMLDKIGVLHDLKEYAAQLEGTNVQEILLGKSVQTSFPNLIRHREKDSYYWPVDFSEPMWLTLDNNETVPIGSSQGLLRELTEINRVLKVEKTFRLQKMVDFMDAGEREIAKIETGFDVSGKFWLKFGMLVARKLAEKSIETNLPVVFQ